MRPQASRRRRNKVRLPRAPESTSRQPSIELAKRHAAFHSRTEEYLRLGLDRLAAANAVVRAAGALDGPALDVGTGKGLLAIELAAQGLEVVSVDLDADEQALAALLAQDARVASRIRFIQGDARAVPFADGHFGCAAMMDVLHHLDEPQPVLIEMARSVRPGGTVVLADFARDGLDIVARVHRAEGRVHPESGTTVAAARAFLEQRGFRRVSEHCLHRHEVAVLTRQRRWPW
jgi:ubiquinone/menaquinone biosynthesis C-methylase UbiE